MKAGFVVGLLIALACGVLCVRLGLWQVSRWHEKQARNAALRVALASEPARVEEPVPALSAL